MACYFITGGTGSFGQAFTRHLLETTDHTIRIFSRDEQKQDEMKRGLADYTGLAPFHSNRLRFIIGDIRDFQHLKAAMRYSDVIIHAAALKIVPVGHYNPDEVIRTNVLGSMNVINAALETGANKVIALSSDKAVAPTNLYGNTKACMERLVVNANSWGSDTKLSCVRYGNVVDSRGSVTHRFREQAKNGKLLVTHPDATRFWITLPQACEFVSTAETLMRGGEIFIPKLQSCRITALAASMYPELPIEFTGLRPGEKIHEWLSGFNEPMEDVGWAYKIDESSGDKQKQDEMRRALRGHPLSSEHSLASPPLKAAA